MIEQRNEVARHKINEINRNHSVPFKKFADLIGVHWTSVAAWRARKWNFREETLSKLERVLERYERLDD